MYLIQILLPLFDNQGRAFPGQQYEHVRDDLTEIFGGLTTYVRSPAKGLWKESSSETIHDDIVIYEVMAERLDRRWWCTYREKLTDIFRQEVLIVRVSKVQLL